MTKRQTFGKLLSNVYIVYIPPIFVWKIPSLALIRWSVFTRGFRQDQKYLPRLREAFKTSKIEERNNWGDENQQCSCLICLKNTWFAKKEILQFIADTKGPKCPRNSWIKGWFLTTHYDTNTGRIKLSCIPNASRKVNVSTQIQFISW